MPNVDSKVYFVTTAQLLKSGIPQNLWVVKILWWNRNRGAGGQRWRANWEMIINREWGGQTLIVPVNQTVQVCGRQEGGRRVDIKLWGGKWSGSCLRKLLYCSQDEEAAEERLLWSPQGRLSSTAHYSFNQPSSPKVPSLSVMCQRGCWVSWKLICFVTDLQMYAVSHHWTL